MVIDRAQLGAAPQGRERWFKESADNSPVGFADSAAADPACCCTGFSDALPLSCGLRGKSKAGQQAWKPSEEQHHNVLLRRIWVLAAATPLTTTATTTARRRSLAATLAAGHGLAPKALKG